MNKVILMGRLARDPEMRQTPTGVSVARLTIAVNRRFSREGQQNADFISCTAWRQTAEFICKYFRKGSMIAIVGNIQTRSWDGQDGKKQFATDVIIDEAYFTGSKSETGGGANGAYSSYMGGQSYGASQGGGYQQPYPQDNYAQPAPMMQENTTSGDGEDFDDFEGAGFAAADGSEDDLPF